MANPMNVPYGPHEIRNEQGVVFQHEGYIYRPCKICGKGFLVARSSVNAYDTCETEQCKRRFNNP